MPQLNENFLKLEKNYLFINIAKMSLDLSNILI